MTAAGTPLWRQLAASARVLAGLRAGRALTPQLDRVDGELRPAVQALTYQALRNLGRAQALRALLARRAPPAPADALLCLALALGWRVEDAPYAPHTLVDQTVEAATRDPALRRQAAFLNACLRRFLREREALVERSAGDPTARWNLPPWWIQRLQRDHPKRWQAIASAGAHQAPMVLRINRRQTTVDVFLQTLKDAGIGAQAIGDCGVLLERPLPVQAIPGFSEGRFSVQDGAAQMAAPLLLQRWPDRSSLNVLDACAAPGGKTAHLLEHGVGRVTALDIDPSRCERISQNLQRLQLQARILAADAAQPKSWWDGEPFDAILLDAPCTASGIVRRHPDIPWMRRETDVPQLAAQQSMLLERLWPLLKVGGRLLFCTCSVFREEGSERVETFVANNKDAHLLPSPGHLMPRNGATPDAVPDNEPVDHDGFFYALLEKLPR